MKNSATKNKLKNNKGFLTKPSDTGICLIFISETNFHFSYYGYIFFIFVI